MLIKSANVLITGGASGIGKIMGRMALEKGAKALIIWDVNQEALETTMAELSSRGRVYIYKVDITNSLQIFLRDPLRFCDLFQRNIFIAAALGKAQHHPQGIASFGRYDHRPYSP